MIHIMKVAVGIDSIEHLQEINQILAMQNNGYPFTMTRFAPKQVNDLINGGSLYRVIKGFLCCRQLIHDIVPGTRENGDPCMHIILEPTIIPTSSIPIRPFQGWRYLKNENIPADLSLSSSTQNQTIPHSMRKDLQALGLL